MRRFCLILCFSVLASMFHAAVMPVQALSSHEAAVTQHSADSLHAEHHCDEQTPRSASPAFKCSLGAHLCCLGLAAHVAASPWHPTHGHSALINPVVLSLELQLRGNKLFKPPKHALLA